MPPTTSPDVEPVAARGARRHGRDRRLRRPADYAGVLGAPRDLSLRAARHWLTMTAAWSPSPLPVVRFGVTVGRRNARRAVDRALVKRVVREASRHAAAGLEAACGRAQWRLDVAFRLKAARPAAAGTSTTAWRRALRSEADSLLQRLQRHLEQAPA